MILIDPPVWAAHGTVWSHLVSDSSLFELRGFARGAGLPDRGFDLDHYDVPEHRHGELVAAGAVPVEGRALVHRLAASDLRVPGRERAGARRPALGARWAALLDPGATAVPGVADRWELIGGELIERWSEPHRVYHGRLHLKASLDALDALLVTAPVSAAEARTARLALWFHDAVHTGEPGHDEERSAALAAELLAPAADEGLVGAAEPDDVARLVLLTAAHDPATGDDLGTLVSDADLAILGTPPDRYTRYAQQVRAEYAEVPDAAFREGRTAVLEGLLALPSLFRTPAARSAWADRAAANLTAELASLAR